VSILKVQFLFLSGSTQHNIAIDLELVFMAQHFLLSTAARTLSLKAIFAGVKQTRANAL
jgi:hypothetical protein